MVEIKCDLFSFECAEHVIIWGGADHLALNSGTHKSHLFTLMNMWWQDGQLESTKNLVFLDRVELAQNMMFRSDDCLILDEVNYRPAEIDYIFQKVRAANAYMIMIGRLLVKQLEYSVGDVYEFEFNPSSVTFHPVFQPLQSSAAEADIILCEDSTQVASVYSTALRKDVKAVYGRSNFYTDVKRNYSPLLIADYSKFGTELLQLLQRLYTNNSNIKTKTLFLFCPDCFERIICAVAKQNGFILRDLNINDFFDTGYFYEELAKDISLWDKTRVAASIIDMQATWDMSLSQTIQELQQFVHPAGSNLSTRCYKLSICNFGAAHPSLFEDESEKNSLLSANIKRSNVF